MRVATPALGLAFSLFMAHPGLAAEPQIALDAGPGREVVANNCQTCHSLDYIIMNSPIQDREGWGKTVTKMIDVMGAPISTDDAQAIVGYLADHYGKADGIKPVIMGR